MLYKQLAKYRNSAGLYDCCVCGCKFTGIAVVTYNLFNTFADTQLDLIFLCKRYSTCEEVLYSTCEEVLLRTGLVGLLVY